MVESEGEWREREEWRGKRRVKRGIVVKWQGVDREEEEEIDESEV